METAKLFMNGSSQAIRLPKEFSFPGAKEVYIHKCGNKIILEPAEYSWIDLRKGVELLPNDFDFKRNPPDYSQKKISFD